MGSKINPGKWDCYENAEPDEPMFILLGRDWLAPMLVRLWANIRGMAGEDPAKVQEARDCANNMARWRMNRRGSAPPDDLVWNNFMRQVGAVSAENDRLKSHVKTLLDANNRLVEANRGLTVALSAAQVAKGE